MFICHVINSLATGGAENVVVNLASEQRRLGHQVKIVTLTRRNGMAAQEAKRQGISTQALANSLMNVFLPGRIRRACKGADIVHVHLFPAFYFGALVHTKAVKLYSEHSTENRRRRLLRWALFERLAYARYSKIIAISEGVAESLRTHLEWLRVKTNVVVIPNGIASEFFENQRKPAQPRVRGEALNLLAIGRLDRRKQFDVAIRAVSLRPETRLNIVGVGPDEQLLRQLVSELGLEDRVRFLGARPDVRILLDDHDALLSSSLYEGFGLAAAESIVRGRPVIAPDVSGLREVVLDGVSGLLYDPLVGATRASQMIARLEDEPELYVELCQGASKNGSLFHPSVAAESMTGLYGYLLSKSTKL